MRELERPGVLQSEIDSTALMCARLLQQHRERGLGPDMGQETAQWTRWNRSVSQQRIANAERTI
jgi:hypothetical protein